LGQLGNLPEKARAQAVRESLKTEIFELPFFGSRLRSSPTSAVKRPSKVGHGAARLIDVSFGGSTHRGLPAKNVFRSYGNETAERGGYLIFGSSSPLGLCVFLSNLSQSGKEGPGVHYSS